MEEEDKEFFILVLGVLAAIIMVISWWFTTGGTATATAAIAFDDADAAHADTDTTESDSAAAAAEPEPEPEATPEPEPEPTPEPEAPEPLPVAASVFDAIAGVDDLDVITGLLRDAGLDQVLATGGPYTLFAPSNDAINSAAGSETTLTVLESARDDVLSYHVVPGTYTVEDLTDIARGSRSTQLTTLQGETISLALEGENIVINGNTAVAPGALTGENGVVHTLDNVLVPPVAALNALVAEEPIFFATGSATIEDTSFPTLDRFIEVLSNSDANVTIEGHTDSSGDPILNQNLSQSRARSVLNYLVANGVEESRLSAVGFGPSRPVADNDTEEGRALNRRIEFTLS